MFRGTTGFMAEVKVISHYSGIITYIERTTASQLSELDFSIKKMPCLLAFIDRKIISLQEISP